MDHAITILLVEDNPGDTLLISEILRTTVQHTKYELICVDSLQNAVRELQSRTYDIILLDLFLPDGSGLDTLNRTLEVSPRIPVVVLSGSDDEELAVQAVHEGAQDYLVKGAMAQTMLARSVRYAMERKHTEEALKIKDCAIAESITGIAMTDLDGVVTYVNRAFLEMWGYNHAMDVLGKPATDFWDVETAADDVLHILSEQGQWSGELSALHKTGNPFPVQLNANIVKNDIGQPLAMMVSFIDISLQKENEQRQILLSKVLERLNASGDLQQMLRDVLKIICRGCSCNRIGLWLKHRSLRQHMVYSQNISPDKDIFLHIDTSSMGTDYCIIKNHDIHATCSMLMHDHQKAASCHISEAGSVWTNSLSATKTELNMYEDCCTDGYESAAFIPLKAKQRSMGFLCVSHQQPGQLQDADITFFERIAGSLSIALTQRDAENALHKSEQRYRLLAENATDVIWTMNSDQKFTFISPSVTAMLGYSMKELNQLTLQDVMVQASYKSFMQVIQEELKKQAQNQLDMFQSRTIELELCRKDGSRLWTETTLSIMHDADKKFTGLLGVSRVITQRKRALEEKVAIHNISQLFLSSDSLDDIYQQLPDMLAQRFGFPIVAIEIYNREQEQMHLAGSAGIDTETMMPIMRALGQSLSGAVTTTGKALVEQDVSRRKQKHFKLLQQLGIRTFISVPLKNKEQLLGTLSLGDLKKRADAQSQVSMFQVIANHLAQEIERKYAEAALQSEKNQLSVTLQSITDGVITTDSKERIVLVNHVAESLLDMSQKELQGKRYDDVVHLLYAKSRTRHTGFVTEILTSGGTLRSSQELMLLGGDKKEMHVTQSGAPICNNENDVIGAVVVLCDITRQRQLEEDLQKEERLASTALLAGGIAHDFNNFLTAILGNVTLAKVYTDAENKVFHILSEAEKATTQARDLTRQLLSFAKGGSTVKQTASIAELIKDSALFSLRGSRSRCVFSIPHDLWPVRIDTGQMTQVINNLIINADQAMPHGGSIYLEARNLTVAAESIYHNIVLKPGEYVEINISDQGMGIPPDKLDRIFDPYYTTKEHGSGLGLATSYFIIKNHNGNITVESEKGHGTSFYIYLPAMRDFSQKYQDLSSAELTLGEGKILLMDDEDGILNATSELLKYLGYDVVCACNGNEAIQKYIKAKAEKHPFDAIIMDLTVSGGMGGSEAMDELLKIDPDAKAILSSGYIDSAIISDYQKHGFKGVIRKPYKIRELSSTLQKVLHKDKPHLQHPKAKNIAPQ